MRYGEWKQRTRSREPMGTLTTVSGVPPLTLSNANKIYLSNYKVFGKTYRSGTPSPSSMVLIQGVGNYNGTSGKYDVGIVSRNTSNTIRAESYLSIIPPLYNGDYIDFANRRIYRDMMEMSVDENSNWISMPGWSTVNSFSAYIDINGIKVNGLSNIECTHFPYYSDIIGKNGMRGNANYGSVYFSLVGITTLVQWKSYLAAEKAAGRTVKIVFQKATKTYDYPSSMPYIPTEKGTNVIEATTAVQPTSMEVTYYAI
jgi:hypothetical protein